MVAVSERFPTEIIVGLNNRQPEWHDLYRVNVVTGERTLLLENDRFMQFVLDDDYRLRFGVQMTPEGGTAIFRFRGRRVAAVGRDSGGGHADDRPARFR